MSAPGNDFATRRDLLAAQIARQRTELAQAYRQLEKPIHMAEYGLRGAGFIRGNPWILVAAPALLSVLIASIGMSKRKTSPTGLPPASSREPAGIKDHFLLWSGRAWSAYQVYRRFRHLLP